MIEKVKKAIADDSLILFVGAGMSMPFKYPSWTGLIQNILEKLFEQYGTNIEVPLEFYIKQGNNLDVLKVLSKLEEEGYKSKVNELLHEEITSVDIKECDFSKQEKLWQISDKIITTNYDKVLEKKKPENIPWFPNFNKFQQSRSIKGNPFLYKIHGDIDDPDTCILFESDYKRLYEEDTPDKETLKSFLQTKTILFLGFSLDDPFVTRQIEYLHNLYSGYSKDHYILQTELKDFRKYNIESIVIGDWGDAFNNFLDDLVVTKKENSKTNKIKISEKKEDVDISKIDDTILLEKMFDEKKDEFDKAEDHLKKKVDKELRVIKDRMVELRTQQFNLDFKIPDHDQNELEHVFDTIYNSETLSDLTKDKINKINNLNSTEYQWYHRSVIVSALACSLVNHRKIDITKIDLLIDFVNESEPKVWQKAITYLFIVLIFLGNRWIRHKKKLESKIERLKLNPEIQESLKLIIYFMQIGLQRKSFLGKYIFENEYFKENPFNYFLPFFKENPSVDKLYDNENIDDIETFITFLYDVPLPDSFKYLICNQENLIVNQMPDNKIGKEEFQDSLSTFTMHNVFEPYLNYASEFLNFYENHPNINKSINEKGTIVEVKNLKNYLLNTIENHRALARQFVIEEQWGKAITHYEQLLAIEENDISALNNLISCFEKTTKSIDDRLKLHLRIEKLRSKDHENLYRIGELYRRKNKYKIALKYFNAAITLDDKDASYFAYRGKVKDNLKDYKGAILDYNKAIELDDKESNYFAYRGETKNNLEDYEDAILDFNKAIELDDKDARYFAYRGKVKDNLENFEDAILDFNKAIELDDKDASYFAYRGKVKDNLENYEGAIADFNKAIELDSKDAGYFVYRGLVKANLEDHKGAILDYNKAVKLDDKKASIFSIRAYSKKALKDFEGALPDYNKAIKLDSKKSAYFDDRGALKADLENYKDAILDYNKSIELNNKNASAYNGKANSLRRINNCDEALNIIDLAININEENGRHYGTKAAIYASQGDDERFYELLEKAFQLEAEANWLDDDIKEKYKSEQRFQELLKKYNQILEE